MLKGESILQLFPERLGRIAALLLEDPREIAGVVEADFKVYIADRFQPKN